MALFYMGVIDTINKSKTHNFKYCNLSLMKARKIIRILTKHVK